MKFLMLLSFVCWFGFVSAQTDSTKKEYLGVLTLTEKYKDEKNWDEKAQGITGQHFQRLLKAKQEGIVVMAGPTDYNVNNPNMMGLVIFYAKDDTEAQQFMQSDPAVKNNIMHAKVHPFKIAVK